VLSAQKSLQKSLRKLLPMPTQSPVYVDRHGSQPSPE
jgi:hypothetical protein